MSLRVGCIDYINILPVTHFLDRPLTFGSPSELNTRLAEGTLDVSPISSIEYARHQGDYVLLPDLSISSRGAVRSVMLFSRMPLESLDERDIGICRATATSRVLLRILLEDYVGVTPRYIDGATLDEARTGAWPAVLLIGDEALAARHDPVLREWHEYDLGQLWIERSGLPMVFAVWAMRREVRGSAESVELMAALHASRELGERLPHALLKRAAERTAMTFEALRTYYGGLHYTLAAAEQRALLTFYRHAASKGLCPPCERLEFASADPICPPDRSVPVCKK